jgi:ribokinase
VTRGAEGATLHRPALPVHEQAALPVDAVDTVGAGDAFVAGLAVALARGDGLPAAVALGAACGALSTRAAGARAALPSLDEAEALLA